MIEISKYPLLGPHGWSAKVTVAGESRLALRVGTRAQIEARAAEVECDMLASRQRERTLEAVKRRQENVRRALQVAL